MRNIIVVLLLIASVICAFAQSLLETKYFQSGDDPIREIHCVWVLDMSKCIISKQQDGGAKINMTIVSRAEPQEFDDVIIYEIECEQSDGLIHHRIVQSIPKDVSKDPIIIFDYQTLNGNHAIKYLPVLKYSTRPPITPKTPKQEMEDAAFRLFMNKVVKEGGGDTIQ